MNINKLKKVFKKQYVRYLNHRLNHENNTRFEKINFLNQDYRLIKGTIRSVADYDDAWLFHISLNAKIVFDVGCNVGFSTLLIAQSKSIERIVLVEPNPSSLSISAENLINNDMSSNVMFIPRAASDKSGETLKLWTMSGAFAAASTDINFTETGSMTKNYIYVKTITLDEIANKYNLYPDLVKIDVEGAENAVLNGATEIARKGKSTFLVEVHSSESMNIIENTEKILNWCKQVNYKAYYLREHAELNDSQSIEKRGRYHLLLIHRDRKYPDGLDKIEQGAKIENIKQSILK